MNNQPTGSSTARRFRWGSVKPPSSILERWVALLVQIAQILALIIGGWWAYSRFIQTEEPAQRQNFAMEQKMEWTATPVDSTCYGTLTVHIENISRAEVSIRKAIRRAWLLPLPDFSKQIAYVDPETLENTPPVDSASYTEGPFIQDYAPGAKVQYDLVWTLQRSPGIALFRIDLFQDVNDVEPIDWIYDWDEICGGQSSMTPHKARPASVRLTAPE